jgi:hypothetical protein
MTIPRHPALSIFCLSGAGQLLLVAAAEEADLPAACILKRAGTPQAQEQEESSMGRSLRIGEDGIVRLYSGRSNL